MPESATQLYLDAPLQRIDLGATRVAYRRYGAGPALLLVHGFPLSGFTWRKILPALSAKYTCYLPDLAGLGETQWTGETDFSFPGHARNLQRFVDQLGLKRYGVLAQDTGGTIARHLALADVARIDKLALINTEVPHHRPPWIQLYQALMVLPGTLTGFRLLMRSRLFLRSGMGFGGCFSDLSLIDGDFHEQVVAPLLRSSHRLEGMGRYLRGLKWHDVDSLAEGHARLAMPVHLIWGADDPTFPIKYAREMVKQFPRATLAEIPGGKLLVHEEMPDAIARACLAFFGG